MTTLQPIEDLPFISVDEQNRIRIQFAEIEQPMAQLEITDGRRLKSGDTAPTFEATLRKENGNRFEVPDEATVLFGARIKDFDDEEHDSEFITGGADEPFENYSEGSVVDAVKGNIAFDWRDATTTDQAGTYEAEVRIVWSDNGEDLVKTFPSRDFSEVTIREGL